MNLDIDKAVEIMKKDQPFSCFEVNDAKNKPKAIVLIALPDLAEKIEAFAKTLLVDK